MKCSDYQIRITPRWRHKMKDVFPDLLERLNQREQVTPCALVMEGVLRLGSSIVQHMALNGAEKQALHGLIMELRRDIESEFGASFYAKPPKGIHLVKG